jgi:hypothetical protein
MLLRSRPEAYVGPHGGPDAKSQGENQSFSKEKINSGRRRKPLQLSKSTIAISHLCHWMFP